MDQIERMTNLMESLALLTGTKKPSVTEQLDKPICTPMTEKSKCMQPDICWFHTEVFHL